MLRLLRTSPVRVPSAFDETEALQYMKTFTRLPINNHHREGSVLALEFCYQYLGLAPMFTHKLLVNYSPDTVLLYVRAVQWNITTFIELDGELLLEHANVIDLQYKQGELIEQQDCQQHQQLQQSHTFQACITAALAQLMCSTLQ